MHPINSRSTGINDSIPQIRQASMVADSSHSHLGKGASQTTIVTINNFNDSEGLGNRGFNRQKANTSAILPKAQLTNFADSRVSKNFVGRSEFIEDLASHFTSSSYNPQARCVRVLFGLPGIGKTQIAMHFAKNYREFFSQIWVIDCRTEASRDDNYLQIAEKLKVPIQGIPTDLIRKMIHRALEDKSDKKPWFLVLDNVDKPIESKKDLPSQGGCILIRV